MDILMVIEAEIATTHLIERILLSCGYRGLRYRKQLLSSLRVDDFFPDTLPLFVRCGDPSLEYWIDLLCSASRPYIYYIDDNFWKIHGNSPLALYYRNPRIRHSLELAVSHASSVITNSTELTSFLMQFNENTCTLPAFFDFSLIDSCACQPTGELRIGFTGSSSRVDDLVIIEPVVQSLLVQFPDLIFEFAGVMPRNLNQSDRVRFFEHNPSYSSFIRFQAERNWSIGLAPLVDTEANRCKTDNKYREYGACRIAGVYSNIPPYSRSVVNGVSGLLVENSTSAWYAAIRQLIANKNNRQFIVENAYADVKMRYCVETVSALWMDHLEVVERLIGTGSSASLKTHARHLNFSRFRSNFRSLCLQITATYDAGGVPLVIRRSLGRVLSVISKAKRTKQMTPQDHADVR